MHNNKATADSDSHLDSQVAKMAAMLGPDLVYHTLPNCLNTFANATRDPASAQSHSSRRGDRSFESTTNRSEEDSYRSGKKSPYEDYLK